MKVTIKHRFSGVVLYEGEHESLTAATSAAVSADADLAGADLAGANLADADLAGANLAGANLAGADLARADLADADLADADFAGADLARANLADAYLARANLADAYLADANLAGANLAGADFAGAAGADLAGANLAGADLARANLAGANLARANLAGANLAGAYLAGANLAGARHVPAHDASALAPATNGPKRLSRVERMQRFRERNPAIPVVERLDSKMLDAISAPGASLDMKDWHTCETTHCRAGWAIHLAGPAGYALEKDLGPERAGSLIYRASTGRSAWFYAPIDVARADIERRAKEETEETEVLAEGTP